MRAVGSRHPQVIGTSRALVSPCDPSPCRGPHREDVVAGIGCDRTPMGPVRSDHDDLTPRGVGDQPVPTLRRGGSRRMTQLDSAETRDRQTDPGHPTDAHDLNSPCPTARIARQGSRATSCLNVERLGRTELHFRPAPHAVTTGWNVNLPTSVGEPLPGHLNTRCLSEVLSHPRSARRSYPETDIRILPRKEESRDRPASRVYQASMVGALLPPCAGRAHAGTSPSGHAHNLGHGSCSNEDHPDDGERDLDPAPVRHLSRSREQTGTVNTDHFADHATELGGIEWHEPIGTPVGSNRDSHQDQHRSDGAENDDSPHRIASVRLADSPKEVGL